MLWSFVIVGLLTFVAAGLGAGLNQSRRERLIPHLFAIALLMIAWIAGHRSAAGWAPLALAAILEVIVWSYSQLAAIKAPATSEEPLVETAEPIESVEESPIETAEPIADPIPREELPAASASQSVPEEAAETPPVVADPVIEPEQEFVPELEPVRAPISPPPPPPPPRVLLPYVTYALLRVTHDITGDVFTASLRRGGRRDASLVGKKADGAWQVQAGAQFIELSRAPKMTPDALAFAAAQSFDWPEAIDFCRNHNALVRLATPMLETTSRAEVLKLHHQAHAALSEFVPIVAIYWEGPGKLAPSSSIKARASERGDRLDLYVSFRSFPDDIGSMTICDTVGLHALGLPDVQITAAGEPDESISNALYNFADDFFNRGCDWSEGQTIQLPDDTTRFVRWSRATHPPDREVIELVENLPDEGDVPAEQFSHDAIGDEQASASEPQPGFRDFEQA